MALHQRRVYLLTSLCNLPSATQAVPTHLLLGTSLTDYLVPPPLHPPCSVRLSALNTASQWRWLWKNSNATCGDLEFY